MLPFGSIIGRAVFASCPLGTLASCASDPTSLSLYNGSSVHFDAIVVHTSGGSCGFRQEIDIVKLSRLNPDRVLLVCRQRLRESCTYTVRNSRVSLSRGNDPGYEFVFTLTGADVSDSGMYEVEVQALHPSTHAVYIITKTFYVTGIYNNNN